MMKKTRGHQSRLALLSFGPVIYPLICALAPCLLAPWAAVAADFQKDGHSKMQLAVSKVLMLSSATLMNVWMHKQWSSTCGLTNNTAAAAAAHIRTNTWKKLQPSSFLLQE
jgi:hypothetical protein